VHHEEWWTVASFGNGLEDGTLTTEYDMR
jgi:hypothetical protein